MNLHFSVSFNLVRLGQIDTKLYLPKIPMWLSGYY